MPRRTGWAGQLVWLLVQLLEYFIRIRVLSLVLGDCSLCLVDGAAVVRGAFVWFMRLAWMYGQYYWVWTTDISTVCVSWCFSREPGSYTRLWVFGTVVFSIAIYYRKRRNCKIQVENQHLYHIVSIFIYIKIPCSSSLPSRDLLHVRARVFHSCTESDPLWRSSVIGHQTPTNVMSSMKHATDQPPRLLAGVRRKDNTPPGPVILVGTPTTVNISATQLKLCHSESRLLNNTG